ncbi:hypothetical protein PIB30_078381, partial [Stylosanthes scabra]|nr:hypothetical protein [Stylosanthes scabra]
MLSLHRVPHSISFSRFSRSLLKLGGGSSGGLAHGRHRLYPFSPIIVLIRWLNDISSFHSRHPSSSSPFRLSLPLSIL